jgi:hypothetical protein
LIKLQLYCLLSVWQIRNSDKINRNGWKVKFEFHFDKELVLDVLQLAIPIIGVSVLVRAYFVTKALIETEKTNNELLVIVPLINKTYWFTDLPNEESK